MVNNHDFALYEKGENYDTEKTADPCSSAHNPFMQKNTHVSI